MFSSEVLGPPCFLVKILVLQVISYLLKKIKFKKTLLMLLGYTVLLQ